MPRSVRASPEILERMAEAPLPAIIHSMGYHWVVLYGQKKQYGQQQQKYIIADPTAGLRQVSLEELRAGWTDWVLLLLEPDPVRFFAQSEDPIRGMGTLLRWLWGFRFLLAEVLLVSLLLGVPSIATPFLIQVLTNDVLIRGDLRLLNELAIAVIVLTLFSSGLGFIQANLIAYFAQWLELGFVLEFGRAIRIGDYNLPDLALEGLRRQVVLVPQEPHFWSRSILENFRLGTPDVSFEQIVRVCQISGADEFISRLPEKYQTVLGEFGANLSGGQRQRLAIARALINDPSILILDESTAGLDPVSETEVLDRLLRYRKGKTTILISHRPRGINRADWIVLLDQGKLMTQGKLEDLRTQLGEHIDFLTP